MADGFADGVVAGMASNDRGFGYGYGYPMPVMPMNYGGGFGNSFGCGGEIIWIILLFVLFGGGFGNGFGMNGAGGAFPWLLASNTNSDNAMQSSFNQASISNGIANLQNSITNGFSNAEVSACNRALADLQTQYNNQIASMNSNFAMQTALQNCCCENRSGLADLKYTVATENCADRQALNVGVRDIMESQNAGIQKVLDKLCTLELDGVKAQLAQAQRDNVGLQNQLNMATLRESQTAQNAFISQGFANEVEQLYNRLNNCPVPTTPVYGRTPIFTCGGNNSCNCNGNI